MNLINILKTLIADFRDSYPNLDFSQQGLQDKSPHKLDSGLPTDNICPYMSRCFLYTPSHTCVDEFRGCGAYQRRNGA